MVGNNISSYEIYINLKSYNILSQYYLCFVRKCLLIALLNGFYQVGILAKTIQFFTNRCTEVEYLLKTIQFFTNRCTEVEYLLKTIQFFTNRFTEARAKNHSVFH